MTPELFELATKHYVDPSGTEIDLAEDLARIKSLRRLMTRIILDGDIKERLIINHLIVLYNVFDPPFVNYLLKTSFKDESYTILNTFLIYLRRSLDVVHVDDDLLAYLKAKV